MNEKARTYQLTCLLIPTLSQAELEGAAQEIKKWISNKQGTTLEQGNFQTVPGFSKKTLGYPIQKFAEAYCWNLEFSLPAETIDELAQYLNTAKNVIRHLINRKKKTKVKPIKEPSTKLDFKIVDKIEPLDDSQFSRSSIVTGKDSPQKDANATDKAASPARPKQEKAELVEEELDKKLQEILNQ